jgi:type I restriction enzyme S subunit
MKLETFFEKFDLFADAPDAVAKMRELIMWSAFSGAFSAEERNQPMPEEWAKEDAPTLPAIPSSWRWQRGSEVFDVIRGVSYKKNEASDNPVEGSFPLLRANNIGNGINFHELVYVPRDNIRDDQFVRRGDILIAMSSGSKKLVGKAAPVVTEFNGAFGAFCGIIRNKSGIPDAVLARYFQSPQYTSWVTAAGRGIGINNLGKGDLDSLPIPTPPLAEQKRIVAKVDELMAWCDRLEAQQQEREQQGRALARAALARFADAPTPANLEVLFHPSFSIPPSDLRKSILTLAVQGKLVPQDPNDEPAEVLLQRVDAERERLVKSKTIRRQDFLSPVPDEDIPFDIPESWQWRYLADVCFQITDGAHHTPQYLESGVPFLSVKDVSSGTIDFSNTRYISEEAHRELCKRCQPEKGDILLTKVGTTGIAVTVDDDREFSIFVSLALLKFSQPNLDGRYLKHLINSPFVKQQSADNTQGIGNKNLVLRLINRFTVPIPPLAEQRRIVVKVDELMALVDALETQLATARTTAANLLAALVAELTATR